MDVIEDCDTKNLWETPALVRVAIQPSAWGESISVFLSRSGEGRSSTLLNPVPPKVKFSTTIVRAGGGFPRPTPCTPGPVPN